MKLRHCANFLLVVFGLWIRTGNTRMLPKPRNLNAMESNPTNLIFAWDQPRGITYQRFLVTISSTNALIRSPVRPNQTTRIITNLHPGEQYTLTVVGVTEEGRTSPRSLYTFYSKPLPPKNVQLEVLNGIKIMIDLSGFHDSYSLKTTGVRATWSPPDRATTKLSGYSVRLHPQTSWVHYPEAIQAESGGNSRVFVHLLPGKEYSFTVRSYTGPPYYRVYSRPVTKHITLAPDKPFRAEVTMIGSTYATIAVVGPVIGMHDDYRFDLSPTQASLISSTSHDTSALGHDYFIITGLSSRTSYTLKVYSLSNGIASQLPVVTRFATDDERATSLKVIYFQSDSVVLQWKHRPILVEGSRGEYLIEVRDATNPNSKKRNVRVSFRNATEPFRKLISGLRPGFTYDFKLYSVPNRGKGELLAAVEQTTIPPQPELRYLELVRERFLNVMSETEHGLCPYVKVSYSPPIPGRKSVQHKLFNTRMNITLEPDPLNKRFSYHIRCVSNHVEGPLLILSSRSMFDPITQSLHDNPSLRKLRLACSKSRKYTARRHFGAFAPDACCGVKPIRAATEQCCGETVLPRNVDSLCCVDTFYSPNSEVCCRNGKIQSRHSGCKGGDRSIKTEAMEKGFSKR